MASNASLAARHLGATQSPSPIPTTKPRLRGALRGLDLENRLSQAATQTSIEDHDSTACVHGTPRHETRSTRNGPMNVNYSQKYHPMDEFTRPKRAQRITGSRSLSTSASHQGPDTSDEDEPELYSASDSSDPHDPDEDADIPAERAPDPRAMRHSARTEARKQVNYSRNYHPMDGAIPGYRRLAKRKRRATQVEKSGTKKTKIQTTDDEPIVLSSEKVIDSDCEDGGEDDRPPIIHPSPAPVSPGEQHSRPASQRTESDESDTASSDDQLPAHVPRGESSFNEAENIIQGKHIARSHRIKQVNNGLPDGGDTITDYPGIFFDEASIREIGATMTTILDDVETPDVTENGTASDERDHPDESSSKPPPATMPVALVTPLPVVTAAVLSEPCTQSQTQLTINRPYMSTQAISPSFEATRKSDKLDPSNKGPSRSIQSRLPAQRSSAAADGECIGPEEQRSGEPSEEASRQALSDVYEEVAGVARAKEVTNRLCSESSSVNHEYPKSSYKVSNSASRQISRDTLPDDPSSNHFEEAIEVTLSDPQHACHDNSPKSSPSGYSQMPVSDRERSDAYAPQEDSNLEVDASGASSHQDVQSSRTAGSSLLRGDDQMAMDQQESHVSDLLPSIVEPGQAVAGPFSEDSMLLRPSSDNVPASHHAAECGDLQKPVETVEESRMHQPVEHGSDGGAPQPLE